MPDVEGFLQDRHSPPTLQTTRSSNVEEENCVQSVDECAHAAFGFLGSKTELSSRHVPEQEFSTSS